MQNLKTKIAAAIVLSFALVWVVSQQIPGVAINGPVVPMDARDVYSTLDPWWAAGVFRDATNSSSLAGITAQRRLRGMLVYTSADSKYWRLSNDLISWVDVSANFGGTSTNNIYNQNGNLTGDRTLSGASYFLRMMGLGSLSGEATGVSFIGTNTFDAHSAVTTIDGKQLFYLKTPSVNSGAAKTNYVLKLLEDGGVATGLVDFLPSSSIYDSDGTISSARTVQIYQGGGNPWTNGITIYGTTNGGSMAGYFSAFGLGAINIFARTNSFQATQEAVFGSPNRTKFISPANNYSTGTNGQVLTIIDGSQALVDFRPLPAAAAYIGNIYTTNGTLAGNRTVTMGANTLNITGSGAITLNSDTGGIKIQTPAFASSITGQALRKTAGGTVEYSADPATPVTLYSGDGTIAGTRSVSVGNNILNFNYGGAGSLGINNANYFGVNAKTNVLYGPEEVSIGTTVSGRFKLALPNVSASANGDIPTLIDKTTALVEYRPPPSAAAYIGNIYTTNGALTGNRFVEVGNNALGFVQNAGPAYTAGAFTITGFKTFSTSAATNSHYANDEAIIGGAKRTKLVTLGTAGATAVNGQVLTLVDMPNSLVEYQTVSNLYTANGSLTSSRTVTIGANTLTTTGTGTITNVAANFGVKASAVATIESASIKFRTPAVTAGTAKVGQDLRLTSLDGTVEFYQSTDPPAHIVVTNMVDLINVPCGSAGPFVTAETQGYYVAGDVGDGFYTLQTFVAGSTNYGNPQSKTDLTKMWKLTPMRQGFTLRQFGAKGDGATDDTVSIQSWLDNLGGVPGAVSPGAYITSGNTFNDGKYVIFGLSPVGMAAGVSITNSAIFRRKPAATGNLFNPIASSPNFTLVAQNIVFDGNSGADSANSASYLFLVQGGSTKGVNLKGVVFMNSAGYGLTASGIWGLNVDGFEISAIKNRPLRLSNASKCNLRHGVIYNTDDSGIQIVGQGTLNTVDDVRVTDTGLDGIFIDSSTRNHFRNCQVFGCKRSSVRLANTAISCEYNKFTDCFFVAANAQNNASSVAASATATWPFVYIDSTVPANYVWHISFKDCDFGGWGLSSAAGFSYGTNEVCNVFKWVGANTLTPWDRWNFEGCDWKMYAWNYNPAMLNPAVDKRSRTVTINCRQNDENSFENFNSSGSLNRVDGLVIESVPTAASNLPLQVSATAHNVTTTGTSITPLLVNPLPFIPPPAEPKLGAPPDP